MSSDKAGTSTYSSSVDQTMSRKRSRTNSVPSNPPSPKIQKVSEKKPETSSTRSTSNLPSRDSDYYFNDGSCILRIENTLFNVHRSILSRDSSSFSTMFTLPQGEVASEGNSDDNPICLVGDHVSEFKNFLWAMYALPNELQTLYDTHVDIPKLLDIAKIANKYNFKSVEAWACDAIEECINRRPSPVTEMNYKEQVTQIIRIAQLCGHDKLLNTMVGVLQQLMSTSPEYLSMALTLADELDINTLTGSAYFQMLLKGQEFWTDSNITRLQKLRLLNGYYRLTTEWEHLRSYPPAITHSPACGNIWNSTQCAASWKEFWRKHITSDYIIKLDLADVPGRLRAILKETDRWGTFGQATFMHHDCRVEVKKRLINEIKRFDDGLAGFFPPV